MGFIGDILRSSRPLWKSLVEGKQLDILLLDVSGSMKEPDYSPSRLDGAKQASINFVQRIAECNPENSAIAVITFSRTASIVAEPVTVKDNIDYLNKVINGLLAAGSTNMCSGLELSEKVIKSSINMISPRVLILTDGHSNCGGPAIWIADRLKKNSVQIDIIGIGGSPLDVNEPQLRQMASVIDGEVRYWFIRSVGELVKKFEDLAIREIK